MYGEVFKRRYFKDCKGAGRKVYPPSVYRHFRTLKNVAITVEQLEKALENKCMFDGSSIEGFVRIEESDMYLEEMGFEIEASHHEVAPGQHEIDFKYNDALTTADAIVTFKLVVKTIAQRHGLHATFIPKPIYGINGSGMHTNTSLFKNGINAFYDGSDPLQLSKDAYWFIGGLMKHMRSIAAITNPLVNSYKRLVPGYEAPVYIAWSARNRSPLIRIPAARGLPQGLS